MQKFFATFGYGSPYKDYYVEIHADSEAEVRRVMVDGHSTKWSFIYSEEEFKPQVYRYALNCLVVICKDEHDYFRATDYQGTFGEFNAN